MFLRTLLIVAVTAAITFVAIRYLSQASPVGVASTQPILSANAEAGRPAPAFSPPPLMAAQSPSNPASAAPATPPATQPSPYMTLLLDCRAHLNAGQPQPALDDALAAEQLDGKRFEAYSLGAVALLQLQQNDKAETAVKLALERAPDAKKTALNKLLAQIEASKSPTSQPAQAATPAGDYQGLLLQAKNEFNSGDVDRALASGMSAIKLDDKRFEAYSLCSAALFKLKRYDEAENATKMALDRAPDAKKPALNQLLAQIQAAQPAASQPAQAAQPPSAPSAEDRLALAELQSISDDLQQAKDDISRRKLLEELFAKSGEYVESHPKNEKVWELRAMSALNLDDKDAALAAAAKLRQTGALDHGSRAEVRIIEKIDLAEWPQQTSDGVVTSRTGLSIIGEHGGSNGAKVGDLVTFYYSAQFVDGKEFESNRNLGPLTVSIGKERLIGGLEEGLIGSKPGQKFKLVIPPELAYGAEGHPPKIPPNSTLVYEIEIVR